MSSYLLDSDVIINILKGRIALKYLLDLKGVLSVSVISIAEVLYGQRKITSNKESLFFTFLKSFDIGILPITLTEIYKYLKIRMYLEKVGQPLENFDLLIAATAIAHDSKLITGNLKHFSRVPSLKIYP